MFIFFDEMLFSILYQSYFSCRTSQPYPGVEKEFFPWGENIAVATDIGEAISYS